MLYLINDGIMLHPESTAMYSAGGKSRGRVGVKNLFRNESNAIHQS